MHNDPYSVLGVGRYATDVEIRAAYRRRALQTHPDKGGTDGAFRQVAEAFEILGDSVRRAAFEQAEGVVEQSANDATGGNSKRRRPRDAPARNSFSRDASPPEPNKRARKDGAFTKSSRRGPSARQSKGSEVPVPSESTFATPRVASADDANEFREGKPCSVAGLVQELLNRRQTSWTKRLDELPDATLVELESFLRDHQRVDSSGRDCSHECFGVGGSVKPDGKAAEKGNVEGEMESCSVHEEEADNKQEEGDCYVDEADRNDGSIADTKWIGEGTSAMLALKGWDEEDEVSGDGGSDIDSGCRGDDFAQGPRVPARNAGDVVGTVATRSAVPTVVAATIHATKDDAGVSRGDVTDVGASAPNPPPAGSGLSQTKLSGVSKTGNGTYVVRVSFNYLTLISNTCRDLNTAIDIHICFVRLRQTLITKLLAGIDFAEALREEAAVLHEERRQSQNPDFRVYYCVRYPSAETRRMDRSMQSANVDEAIKMWKDHHQKGQQKRFEAMQHCVQRKQKREEAQKRLPGLLLICVQRSRESRREEELLARWGVRTLPNNVELASLHLADDCVCATLQLSDGSVRRGPLRKSLRDAEIDATDLARLQSRFGDTTACAELERRDVAAMTAHFLELV
eukprot:TRINITY_DN7067_c0_g2_i1.p1 TRINITY_DN7067_c0_g2~~TRINITY_DN7067_c0_g2_i1.p1  ORF type:complete len:628 (-),score=101.01 TRINITY_DN7067_c0_g2_i1:103-1986(-)